MPSMVYNIYSKGCNLKIVLVINASSDGPMLLSFRVDHSNIFPVEHLFHFFRCSCCGEIQVVRFDTHDKISVEEMS